MSSQEMPMKRFAQTFVFLFWGIAIPLLCLAQEHSSSENERNEQVITEFSIYDDSANAMAVQPDGKIVVAGKSDNGVDTDFAVARYLPNGSLDRDFNQNGLVTIAVGAKDDAGLALVIQEDGKIVVAGTTENETHLDAAVVRLHPDGGVDLDFNQDGQFVLPLPESDDRAQSVLLQKDGKIVIAGSSENEKSSQVLLIRLNSDGSLDATFGDNGFASNSNVSDSAALGAVQQTDGQIILAGFTTIEEMPRAALFSFLENGAVNEAFGTTGFVLSGSLTSPSRFYDLKLVNDTHLIAAGTITGDEYRSVLLAKFTHTGKVDTQFNGNGLVQMDLGVDTVAHGLTITPDDSIYIAGSSSKNEDTDFILLHFDGTGYPQLPDTETVIEEEEEEETTIVVNDLQLEESSKPAKTYTLTDFANYNDVARAIHILEDGTVVLAGSANNGKDNDFALSFYNSELLASLRQQGGKYTSQAIYISTTPPTMVMRNSAASGGYIRNTTKTPYIVNERGVCYGVTPAPGIKNTSSDTAYQTETNPTISVGDDTENPIDLNPFKVNQVLEGCTSDGSGTGEFRSDLLNLTPDTTYYIRSYAILSDTSGEDLNENTIIYGNELQFKTADACFIATAAHGSINQNQVVVLRHFRDAFLKSSAPGKQLIAMYYQLSPPLAELISESPMLQQITQTLLGPITMLAYFSLYPMFTLKLFIILLLSFSTLQWITARYSTHLSIKNRAGFTLIELLVVIVIIAILAGYVGPKIMGHPEEAKRTMAMAQISSLETALETYKLDNGTYPSTEQGLQALVEPPSVGKLPPKWRKGGYMKKGKVPKDPWGNEYIYLSPGTHSDFDLSSYGADHESGGEDDDADVNNWEIE